MNAAATPNPPHPMPTAITAATLRMIATTRAHWLATHIRLLPLQAPICVDFGNAALTRDGRIVYRKTDGDAHRLLKVADAEELARLAPHREWCIHLVSPVGREHFRRVADSTWALYAPAS